MSTHRKLFGTDGVRGVANLEPITSETALKLGRALAHVFRNTTGRHRRILIGKDTRLSGYMLETAMESGICSMGVDVWLVGPLPTPAIAFLTRSMRADAGIVISASHNPFQDNGIKFFSREGFKLDDETERRIEALVFDEAEIEKNRARPDDIGKATRIDDALGRYLVFLKSCLPRSVVFDGLKVAIDCANGAAYKVGPEALEELGAEVVTIGVDPDGKNINLNCGAMHLDAIRETVLREHCNVGIALDGDGDRVMLIDERGEVCDGDDVMALLGRKLAAEGRLARQRCRRHRDEQFRTRACAARRGRAADSHRGRRPLGRARDAPELVQPRRRAIGPRHLHGSLDHRRRPDQRAAGARATGRQRPNRSASCARCAACRRCSKTSALKIACRWLRCPTCSESLPTPKQRLAGTGRLLVRYSGTEMLARVMVEGEDAAQIKTLAQEIGAAIQKYAGAILGAELIRASRRRSPLPN